MKPSRYELALTGALALSIAANVATVARVSNEGAKERATMVQGVGCADAPGTIYAIEEDDLPYCVSIKRINAQAIVKGARHD